MKESSCYIGSMPFDLFLRKFSHLADLCTVRPAMYMDLYVLDKHNLFKRSSITKPVTLRTSWIIQFEGSSMDI